MKYSFSLIQVANWIYLTRNKLKILRQKLDTENVSKEEAISALKAQKNNLELIKDVINKKSRLLGIQPDFLKNLENLKREMGIE